MRKLDPKSAGDPDGVPIIFLKSCEHSLSPPLAHLFFYPALIRICLQVGGSLLLHHFLKMAFRVCLKLSTDILNINHLQINGHDDKRHSVLIFTDAGRISKH